MHIGENVQQLHGDSGYLQTALRAGEREIEGQVRTQQAQHGARSEFHLEYVQYQKDQFCKQCNVSKCECLRMRARSRQAPRRRELLLFQTLGTLQEIPHAGRGKEDTWLSCRALIGEAAASLTSWTLPYGLHVILAGSPIGRRAHVIGRWSGRRSEEVLTAFDISREHSREVWEVLQRKRVRSRSVIGGHSKPHIITGKRPFSCTRIFLPKVSYPRRGQGNIHRAGSHFKLLKGNTTARSR
jgi:hypothetical protein